MIDQTIIILAVGFACIVLGVIAGYIQGRNAAKMKSVNWWTIHDKHIKALKDARHDRAVGGGHKSHETHKRRTGRATDTVTKACEG